MLAGPTDRTICVHRCPHYPASTQSAARYFGRAPDAHAPKVPKRSDRSSLSQSVRSSSRPRSAGGAYRVTRGVGSAPEPRYHTDGACFPCFTLPSCQLRESIARLARRGRHALSSFVSQSGDTSDFLICSDLCTGVLAKIIVFALVGMLQWI
jgi:hypothetical protein